MTAAQEKEHKMKLKGEQAKDKVAAVKEIERKKGLVAKKENAAKKEKMEGMSEKERKVQRRKLEKTKEVQVKTGQSTQVRLDQESAMRRTERMQKAKLQTKKDEDARKEG